MGIRREKNTYAKINDFCSESRIAKFCEKLYGYFCAGVLKIRHSFLRKTCSFNEAFAHSIIMRRGLEIYQKQEKRFSRSLRESQMYGLAQDMRTAVLCCPLKYAGRVLLIALATNIVCTYICFRGLTIVGFVIRIVWGAAAVGMCRCPVSWQDLKNSCVVLRNRNK